jgi:hypothetical protein
METAWFFQEGDQRRGPVTGEQLVVALTSAPDPRRILVWHAGLPGWTAAGNVPELSQHLPPPLPAGPLPQAAQIAQASPYRLVPVEEAEGIARLYRRLVLLVGLQILLGFAQILISAVPDEQRTVAAMAVVGVLLVVLTALAVTAYQLTLLLDAGSPIIWAIAMFIPCINIIVLLVLSAKAQTWCQRYGIKVGFLGPTKESIEALRKN